MNKRKRMKWDAALFLEDERDRALYLFHISKFKNNELMELARNDVERSRILHENKLVEA